MATTSTRADCPCPSPRTARRWSGGSTPRSMCVKGAGVRGLFIPGNHDWEKEGSGGWEAVRREGARVAARGGPVVAFLPRDGCPGPEVVGPRRPRAARGPRHAVVAALRAQAERPHFGLRRVLRERGDRGPWAGAQQRGRSPGGRGRRTTPSPPAGPTAAISRFAQHLFPLTEVKRGLWIPLPLIGSLYPLARKRGASPQDIADERNGHMREALEDAFRGRPAARVRLGARARPPGPGRPQRAKSAGERRWHLRPHEPGGAASQALASRARAAGFMRLDLAPAGTRLAVLAVNARGSRREVYAEWLRSP